MIEPEEKPVENIERILILEDSELDAELIAGEIRPLFPEADFRRVDTEEAFKEALDAFKPQLILSDYNLPQFNGLKALRLEQEACPETPFIIITGSMNEETAVQCMKAGAWDYVIKEHLRRLGPSVLACLEQQKLRRKQREAETALREQEAYYRLLFETAPVGILTALPDGTITGVNPEALNILGSPSAEATMSINLRTFPPLAQAGLAKDFERCLEERRALKGERPYTTKWGKSIVLSYQVTPIFEENGEIESLQIILQDFTERRRAEDELRRREEEEKRFSQRMEKLLAAINQFSREASVDDICRRAVETARAELDIDRIAFWFFNAKKIKCHGTWGTDESGRLRDERRAVVKPLPENVVQLLDSGESSLIFEETALLNDKGKVVGYGHHAVAALYDGEAVVGFLSADNLLQHRPLTDHDQRLLKLLASGVGHMCSLKRAEQKLKAAVDNWNRTFNAMRDGIALLDADNRVLQSNAAFQTFVAKSPDELSEGFCYQHVHGTHAPIVNCPFELAKRTGRRERMEMKINDRVCEVMVDPIFDDKGTLVGAVHIMSDISERKKIEEERERLLETAEASRRALLSALEDQKLTAEELKKSEERYRTIFENIQDVYLETDETGRILEISPSVALLSAGQYRREELLGVALQEFADPEALRDVMAELMRNGRVSDREILVRNKDGTLLPCALTASLWKEKGSDKIKIVGSLRDITDRKRAEEQLRNELEIKKTLLQELYHRTKNNMQVIISMMRVYGARITDPTAREILNNIELKIHSMALVHQKLYQSKSLSHVNLKDYFHDLIGLLQRSNPHFAAVTIKEELEEIGVLIDTAIPLGTVFSELVSNMVKHAFPDGRRGMMSVKLFRDEQGHIVFETADNGVGLPEGFDPERDGGTGMATIFAQAKHQLDGDITLENRNGLVCRIVLKKELYFERVKE